jgi:hypothetical protein
MRGSQDNDEKRLAMTEGKGEKPDVAKEGGFG